MDGKLFAQIISEELIKKEIPKGKFYNDIGVTSAAMWGWRNGATPKPDTVKDVEKYLGISFSDIEKSDPREELREDLKTLLKSAEDLPPSSVYELIAEIHRRKEMGKVDSSS